MLSTLKTQLANVHQVLAMNVQTPQCQLVKTIEASKRKTDEHELLVKRENAWWNPFFGRFSQKKVAFRPSAILILGKNEFYEHGFRSAGMIYCRNMYLLYYTSFYSIYIYIYIQYVCIYIYTYMCACTYVYIYIYIWVCDCECKCDPHKLGHIISVYATMAYYGHISSHIHWSGTARPVGFGATVRVDSDCFGGGQCHPQQKKKLSKTVTKWSQTCGNTVGILKIGMRLTFWFFHNNNRQTHKSIQNWTLFPKNPSTSKNSVCVCGMIASRYFSEYLQTYDKTFHGFQILLV